jgi:hypothetical protein
MKLILLLTFAITLAVSPRPAAAQTIDGARLNIYPGGAAPGATPTTFFDFLSSAITCNLAPPAVSAAGPAVNPTRVMWDDPTNTGRVCQWTDPGTGPLFSVPVGSNYEASLQFFNAAGRGPESNRAPFTRLAPPATAPTGVRLQRLGS